MAYKMKSAFGFLLAVACSAVIGMEFYKQMSIAKREQKSIRMLQEADLSVYWVGPQLYKLNCLTRKWESIPQTDNIVAMHSQDVDICNQIIFYSDFWKEHILCAEPLPDKTKNTPVEFSIRVLGTKKVSHDCEKIAYQRYLDDGCTQCICVFYLKENQEKRLLNIESIDSLDWSHTDESIFYSVGGRIYMVDVQTSVSTYVTDGYWVSCLSDNEIAFCRTVAQGDKYYKAAYRYDLDKQTLKEVFRTRHFILGMNWDSSGRYVFAVLEILRLRFLIIPDVQFLPVVWDTETGERYDLPRIYGKSGCILPVNNQSSQQ
ncbi:MAG: hypothetical protein WHS88_08290 [Anaerohalosphaeraceae bacterium]